MDDYMALIDNIRREAADHPPVVRWEAMQTAGGGPLFDVLIQGNE